jgi:hypothetical protein
MEPRRNTTLSGKRAGLPFKDDLPTVGVTRLRREGVIRPDSLTVKISFGELEREISVTHRQFPNGGGWSFFLCPNCSRRVRNLRLFDGRIVCRWCDGLMYRCQSYENKGGTIERLRQALYGPNPAKLRRRLEIALRRALLRQRRKWL